MAIGLGLLGVIKFLTKSDYFTEAKMFKKITDGLAKNEDGAEVSWGVRGVTYTEEGKELSVYGELHGGSENGGTAYTVVFGVLKWNPPFENEKISGFDYERIKHNIREGMRTLFDDKDELQFAEEK